MASLARWRQEVIRGCAESVVGDEAATPPHSVAALCMFLSLVFALAPLVRPWAAGQAPRLKGSQVPLLALSHTHSIVAFSPLVRRRGRYNAQDA